MSYQSLRVKGSTIFFLAPFLPPLERPYDYDKMISLMICNYNLKIKFVHDRVVVLKYHNGKLVNKMHIVSYEIYLFYGKLLID